MVYDRRFEEYVTTTQMPVTKYCSGLSVCQLHQCAYDDRAIAKRRRHFGRL